MVSAPGFVVDNTPSQRKTRMPRMSRTKSFPFNPDVPEFVSNYHDNSSMSSDGPQVDESPFQMPTRARRSNTIFSSTPAARTNTNVNYRGKDFGAIGSERYAPSTPTRKQRDQKVKHISPSTIVEDEEDGKWAAGNFVKEVDQRARVPGAPCGTSIDDILLADLSNISLH